MKKLWILLGVLVAVPASAQDRVSPALALARICVSEAGWTCFDTGDGIGIHEVILRGAEREGIGYVSFARRYSSRVMGVAPSSEARRWLAHLDETGAAPEGWPTAGRVVCSDGACRVSTHPAWSHYRDRWLAVLERAREVVTWRLDDWDEWGMCDDEVHDWGGRMDRARAERNGLVEVECGDTRNDFYARPHLLPPVEPEPDGCGLD